MAFEATTCLHSLPGDGITPPSDSVSKVVPAHNSIILNSIWKLGTGTVLWGKDSRLSYTRRTKRKIFCKLVWTAQYCVLQQVDIM